MCSKCADSPPIHEWKKPSAGSFTSTACVVMRRRMCLFFTRLLFLQHAFSIHSLQQIKIFLGRQQEFDVLCLHCFEYFEGGLVAGEVFFEVSAQRCDIFDETAATRAAAAFVHRVGIALRYQGICLYCAVDDIPIGAELLSDIVHQIEENDLCVSARIVRVFKNFLLLSL